MLTFNLYNAQAMSNISLPFDITESREVRQKVCHYIVEGDSEENYISQLLQLVREYGEPQETWKVVSAGGGTYARIQQALDKHNTAQDAPPVDIWMDDDIVMRDAYDDKHAEERRRLQQYSVLYNIHKFEDFLLMHYPLHVVEAWHSVCSGTVTRRGDSQPNYLQYPIERRRFAVFFHEFLRVQNLAHYEKGKLPFPRLTVEHLKNLMASQKSSSLFCKSDMVSHIHRLLTSAGIDVGDI